ncbi:HemK2/MTQ2 family protein methyltransferase [Streptomyces sp. NPDC002580]|uniref:HemK2/MTQ2 family protein methyltransferase n=1 Tax=Streptomyces sp. NPDC002580 TaxID=3364653 RepID=UPI0036769821
MHRVYEAPPGAADLDPLDVRHGLGPLWRLPGVYPPQEDTLLLARAVRAEAVAGSDVLDIGTGSGALALCAAEKGARVTAVDVSWRAALTTWVNARHLRLPVEVRRGSAPQAVRGRRFDLVISNPPYVPAPHARPPRRGAARSWDAGRDGRAVIDEICVAAPVLLKAHGALLMVHSALSGVDATLAGLAAAGLRGEIMERAHIPYGPVVRSRLAWLLRQGLVRAGQQSEELVVIRAERRNASAHSRTAAQEGRR